MYLESLEKIGQSLETYIKRKNLITALHLGYITWFQFFEEWGKIKDP